MRIVVLNKQNWKQFKQISWSDSIRAVDPSYFCRKTIEAIDYENLDTKGTFILWIVTDARRKTDLEYFKSTYPGKIRTIRVVADEAVRIQRNWVFCPGLYRQLFTYYKNNKYYFQYKINCFILII